MKIIFNLLVIIFKSLLCSFFTVVISYLTLEIIIGPILRLNEWDWQILLYLISAIFTILGLWAIFFIKTKIYIKLIYAILFILHFNLHSFLPSVMKQLDHNFCLDTGICAQGLKINTEHGRIKINKENCLKYGWEWDEKRKWCDLRSN